MVRLLLAAVLVVVTACRAAPSLSHAHPSAESLAAAVLDGVARRDRAALATLALDDREFRDHAWPDLPAAQPERNLPYSYVWGDLHQKSEMSLGRVLGEYGGQHFTLLGVDFDAVTPYSTYRVHRGTRLRVRHASGNESIIRVCGSMLEKDGRWKLFSYVVTD